ncbi:MAG: outer membrane protein assembly factor BamB [Pseudomonadales bacterium]|nr:outer membrane protein assembly factor BamB [Pseudomonadales bacterium]
MMNRLLFRFTYVLTLLGMLSSCGWFGGDDNAPEEIEPNPLPNISQEVDIDVIWNRKIGDGAGDRAIRISPAVVGGRVFSASASGQIKAMTTDTGREIWAVEVEDFYTEEERVNGFSKKLDVITGGVGAGGDLIAVGTGSGDLLALNQSDGSFAWKVSASSEILAPPQIDDNIVVVQTIDGKVAAYDPDDGARRWIYTSNIPSLTLRGTATPIIFGEVVIAAFSNGRVSLLSKDQGLAGYDQRVGVSQGASDLERLVDIDGALALDGSRLYVASFQGRLVGIDLNSGRILWAEDASSIAGVGAGFGNVYLATADSQVVAFNASDGREVWREDALLYRDINSPVTIGSYLAFTDFEGYLHLLAQSDGRFVGRRRLDSGGVRAPLISEGGRLFAMGNGGSLSAMEIR